MNISDKTYAVIMAGGRGERFWPLSTQRRPKQLLALFEGKPLITRAVERIQALIPKERIFVITNRDIVDATAEALPDFPANNIIGEPCGRDTAAAVALGTAIVRDHDPQGVFCVLTADHIIKNDDVFRRTLDEGMMRAAPSDAVITIGIPPTCPSTGFGYIEVGEEQKDARSIRMFAVKRFVEKPDLKTAETYLATGRFYWNSGMFIWSVQTIYEAFQTHRPVLAAMIDKLSGTFGTDRFAPLMAELYSPLEKISIDYAIMEKVRHIVMARCEFTWADVGSWPALKDHFPADANGNILIGNVEIRDAADCIAVSGGSQLTALLGVKDLVVVQAPGVTLVCHRDKAQDIKGLLQNIKNHGGYEHVL